MPRFNVPVYISWWQQRSDSRDQEPELVGRELTVAIDAPLADAAIDRAGSYVCDLYPFGTQIDIMPCELATGTAGGPFADWAVERWR